ERLLGFGREGLRLCVGRIQAGPCPKKEDTSDAPPSTPSHRHGLPLSSRSEGANPSAHAGEVEVSRGWMVLVNSVESANRRNLFPAQGKRRIGSLALPVKIHRFPNSGALSKSPPYWPSVPVWGTRVRQGSGRNSAC